MEKKGNIILLLNRRCTVGCASCNAGANIGNNANELTVRWLEPFFKRIQDLPFSNYIIWTGGEPFLSFESLKIGILLASQQKLHSEIITSGAWFEQTPEHLENLDTVGKFSLRISLDAEHQDSVPISIIIALIHKAQDLGIEINFTLREIPGRPKPVNDSLAKIKERLPAFYRQNHIHSRWLHYLPHMPVTAGSGCRSPHRASGQGKQKWKKACQIGFKDLIVGEDGLVYPCCGLFGIPGHEQLSVGDPLKESWNNLKIRQSNHPLLQVLKKKGPYGICQELGLIPETWNWPTYETPCHLCLALFHLHNKTIFEYF